MKCSDFDVEKLLGSLATTGKALVANYVAPRFAERWAAARDRTGRLLLLVKPCGAIPRA
jgi:hypothetical protein